MQKPFHSSLEIEYVFWIFECFVTNSFEKVAAHKLMELWQKKSPADMVINFKSLMSVVPSFAKILLAACNWDATPRILKEPVVWQFSSLRNKCIDSGSFLNKFG